MRIPSNLRALLFLCVMLVSAMHPLSLLAKDADRVADEYSAVRFGTWGESIVALALIREADEGREMRMQGSGSIVGTHERFVLTALHVGGERADTNGYGLYAFVDGTPCLLTPAWKHAVADVKLWRFACNDVRTKALPSLPFPTLMPKTGEAVSLIGYQDTRRAPLKTFSATSVCEKFLRATFCRDRILLTMHGTHVPMVNISADEEIKRQHELYKAREKKLWTSYADLFFDDHLVARRAQVDERRLLEGFSGGALLNDSGEIVGVFSGDAGNRVVFTPIDTLPKELLDGTW